MKTAVFLFAISLQSVLGQANFLQNAVTAHSRSKQFVVQGPPRPFGSQLLPHSGYERLFLDPAIVAVNCEQIKTALLQELDLPDVWKSKIFILLRPVRGDHENIFIRSTQGANGWVYHVQIPNEITTRRLVRGILDVLLREIANRTPGNGVTELPDWLCEGLTSHLISQGLFNFALQSKMRINETRGPREAMAGVRQVLQSRTPLSFDEISWPGKYSNDPGRAEVYQNCAHLLVVQLLQLRNGNQALQKMVRELPLHLNWQLSFLKAFRPHFGGLIDVEKWWAITLVQFAGREPSQSWVIEHSMEQLDAILRIPVHISAQTNALPVKKEVRLQEVIVQWDFAKQAPMLSTVLNQLKILRLRAAPNVASLVEEYHHALEGYFNKRQEPARSGKTQAFSSPIVLVRDVCQILDRLDTQRQELRSNQGKVAQRPPK